jgi:hypothetical protein
MSEKSSSKPGWTANSSLNQLVGTSAGLLAGDKLEIALVKGRWVLAHLPARPRPKAPPVEHFFPTE